MSQHRNAWLNCGINIIADYIFKCNSETPSKDELIEKIMDDIDELYIWEWYPRWYIEEILTKHLSSK
jgi:hypothetical protein